MIIFKKQASFSSVVREGRKGHREATGTLFGGHCDRVIDQVAVSSSALNLNQVYRHYNQRDGYCGANNCPK